MTFVYGHQNNRGRRIQDQPLLTENIPSKSALSLSRLSRYLNISTAFSQSFAPAKLLAPGNRRPKNCRPTHCFRSKLLLIWRSILLQNTPPLQRLPADCRIEDRLQSSAELQMLPHFPGAGVKQP